MTSIYHMPKDATSTATVNPKYIIATTEDDRKQERKERPAIKPNRHERRKAKAMKRSKSTPV